MSEGTATTFPVGSRVIVSAEAHDVWFGGMVAGTVVPSEEAMDSGYAEEGRVNVRARDETGMMLTQYVRPEDLTLVTDD